MDKIIRMVREVKDTTIAADAVNSDKFLTRERYIRKMKKLIAGALALMMFAGAALSEGEAWSQIEFENAKKIRSRGRAY